MSDIILPVTIGGIIGAFVAIGKIWMDAGVTKQKATEAHANAHEAHQRIDGVVKDLSTFMAQASREFATPADIASVEQRFIEAVNGMRSDFREMTRRLDTLLKGH